MEQSYQNLLRWGWLVVLLLWLLPGCSDDGDNKRVVREAMAVEAAEECHLCGMVILKFPGPKGQLYQRGHDKSMKFCSTRDMFAYLLDPEHTHNIQEAYVHNMAVTPWASPGEDSYIDARQAWYVIGHSQKGAMGPTLATFKQESDAADFAIEFGGKLYRFEQLTTELVSTMGQDSHQVAGGQSHGHR